MKRALSLLPLLLVTCSSCSSTPVEDAAPFDAAIGDSSLKPAHDAGASDTSVSPPDDASTPQADAAPPVDAAPPPDPAIEEMHTRADQALATLMLADWPALRANTNTYDWMYAHYWDAVLDAAERRGKNAFAGTARMFFDLQAQRGWLDGFYDDENWVTLALLHAYRVTGEKMYLDQAKVVFDDIMKAWDTTCCGSHKGGLYWKKPAESKVTAINAGAVISGSRLYAATNDQTYLAFAKKAYAFWSTTMVDTATGHVYDGMDNSGNINTSWSFTYNEGLFIGAIVELARVTNDTSNFALAHKVAGYMMSKEIETTSLGTILSDGKCSGDGQMFKAVGARYLGELFAADPSHTEYRDFLHRSGDAIWTLARNASTGHISCDWEGPFDSATDLVGSLGSAAIGLAAAATALGPATPRAALTYEAEEGNLHGIGLEASYSGFSGWGYLAGWGNDGQSVDFLVEVADAGSYDVAFRYATGDAASRAVSVNGKQATASLAFASTGGYSNYADAKTTVTLPAGKSTITVAFSKDAASAGYLNLDRAVLTKK